MPNDNPKPLPVSEGSKPEGGIDTGENGRMVHRGRKLSERPAWKITDIVSILGLVAALLPAWILPERLWAPLWQGLARIPIFTSRRAARRTGKTIEQALGKSATRSGAAIARDLKAAVHEMRMQDLRAWRPGILGGGWRPRMVLEGEEHLEAALAGGRGAVLWLAPFVFNSGPTKIAIHARGYKVSHLSSPIHGYSETRFGVSYLNKVRCIPEDKHIVERVTFDKNAPANAMRRLMRAVKGGDIATIVAASTEGAELVKAPVFGGLLPVAVGAPRLAGLTGAPLLPVFTVRDPELGFRVVLEAPIVLPAEFKGDARVMAAAAEFLRRSEPWVRRYPEQWRAWSKWRG